jgi:hypothetical protein
MLAQAAVAAENERQTAMAAAWAAQGVLGRASQHTIVIRNQHIQALGQKNQLEQVLLGLRMRAAQRQQQGNPVDMNRMNQVIAQRQQVIDQATREVNRLQQELEAATAAQEAARVAAAAAGERQEQAKQRKEQAAQAAREALAALDGASATPAKRGGTRKKHPKKKVGSRKKHVKARVGSRKMKFIF